MKYLKLHPNLPIVGSVLAASLLFSGCASSNAASTTTAKPVMQPQAYSQPAPHGDPRKPKHAKRGNGWKDLDLTATQQAQIEQIKARNNVAMKQLKASIAQQEATIAQQKQAGVNTATLLALHQQRQNSVEQMMALKKQQRQQMLSVLTPEQQLKFYERQTKRGWDDGKRAKHDKHDKRRPMNGTPNSAWQSPAQGSNAVQPVNGR